ncbi:MAG: hypothetical protein ACJZ2B_04205 [Candidatus Neomarinimicrobiota bacterium]|tara:strand:+ start:2071 stop:6039 length:3969 start_codon:yes stop_codon:yes gene_type:complete
MVDRLNAFLLICFSLNFLLASSPKGNSLARAKNDHSGNKIRTTFYNYGLVGRWSNEPEDIGGEWPINSGHEYIGDVGHMVGTEFVNLDNIKKKSVITIDSPRGSEFNLDTHWGWEPLSGYSNPDTPLVAMSHMGPSEDDNANVNTWPDQWADKLDDPLDPGWAGSWNGYFGKDQKNAEQESYFVMDDAQDAEFFYYPDSNDLERRGMGLRCTQRGLQWNHILAEDVLFWLYDIKNISDYDMEKMVFGYIVGTITGGDGDSGDDWADFEKSDDIAFSYDNGTDLETGLGGIGASGWSPVGLAGYAFLESPGNPYDGIDNDGDGSNGTGLTLSEEVFSSRSYGVGDTVVVIDYQSYERTLVPMSSDGIIIYKSNSEHLFMPGDVLEEIPRNLIDDNLNGLIDENNGASIEFAPGIFEDTYLYFDALSGEGLKYIDYFSGIGSSNALIDESREDGIDNDGDWNIATDDVGIDGMPGSGDLGEGDGLPTSGMGTELPGEPNIDKTDVDESDQIGLSSFYYFNFGVGPQMDDDPRLWEEMLPGYFNNSISNTDADFLFSSGYFPLKKDLTERFSIALLFGDNLPDLVRNKQTVQTIYNQNYNFAKAPDLPSVWAYSGDGYVTLYWDDNAELSVDRITGDDFEGYKIYKATDTQFTDAGVVTDAFGTAKFNIPIKQYDKVNEYQDFYPGHVDGIQFYLGNNSGLVHSWTDTNVINGHRYFYAVTAYDHGSIEKEILPAETSKFVTMNRGGKVITAKNVVAIVPDVPAVGYVEAPKEKDVYPISTPVGTGTMKINNIDPSKIPDNNIYQIYFKDTRMNMVDDDGDWSADSHDVGFDGCTDYFEDGLGGCNDYANPIANDENQDNWNDCGIDGICNEQEFGFDAIQNPDPSNDDYDYNNNPYGTEGNGEFDLGEKTENNGVPDLGEPNLDILDLDEALPQTTEFMVVNVTSSTELDTVVPWSTDLDGDLGQFDGMVLEINNQTSVNVDNDLSHFYPKSESDYDFTFSPFSFGGIATKGVAYPRNYGLVFSDSASIVTNSVDLVRENGQSITIDSSMTNFKVIDLDDQGTSIDMAIIDRTWTYYSKAPGLPDSIPVDSIMNSEFYLRPDQFDYFNILDTVVGSWSDFGFSVSPFGSDYALKLELARQGHFSYSDRIIIMESVGDTSFITWNVTPGHDNIPNLNTPKYGDTLSLYTTKPFSSLDIYEFISKGASFDQGLLTNSSNRIKVVPNPYIVAASWEGQNPYADGRGPRSIHFNHLPPQCKIQIFTLSGELVNTLMHNTSLDDGSFEWNMLTKDNLDISYGVYFYHVEPMGQGLYDFKPHLGKFAVIK